ncbi:hypothetical protein EN802_04435 [bacterium M00.F.Ca.ET.159.01.1.1]|nr:hypothetical protein EN802_04435 [bacterium M00.F.Ca.ET.159.01.1.1]TGT81628.1 hypothetical protein EN800_22515 [bacterium M00.F.Ca.ET.157.01.1.1]
MRFWCSRTKSTFRSGSRNPPFSTRPDPILDRPCAVGSPADVRRTGYAIYAAFRRHSAIAFSSIWKIR